MRVEFHIFGCRVVEKIERICAGAKEVWSKKCSIGSEDRMGGYVIADGLI